MFRNGSRFPCPFFLVKTGFGGGGVHHLGLSRKKCLKRKTDNELVQVCHVFCFFSMNSVEFVWLEMIDHPWLDAQKTDTEFMTSWW